MKRIKITLSLLLIAICSWGQTNATASQTTPALNMDSLMSAWRTQTSEISAKGRALQGTSTDVNYSESTHGSSEKEFTYNSVTLYKQSLTLAQQNDSLTLEVYNKLKTYAEALKTDATKKDVCKTAKMHMREVKAADKIYKKEIKQTQKIIDMLMKRYEKL